MTNDSNIELLGVRIDCISMADLVEQVGELVKDEQSKPMHVVTPNPEMVLISLKNERFRNVLNNADFHLPDGIGLLMAVEFMSYRIPNIPVLRELYLFLLGLLVGVKGILKRKGFRVIKERVSGSDFFNQLLMIGEKEGWQFFFLGGEQGVVYQAQDNIRRRHPQIKIVGVNEGGYVDRDGCTDNDDQLVEQINSSGAKILLTCFGAPRQDYWIASNISRLKNIKLAMGAGGTLDFWAQKKVRAPKILQSLSLEWVWRLVIEPQRWQRIWRAFPVFPLVVAINKYSMIKYGHGGKQKRNDLQEN